MAGITLKHIGKTYPGKVTAVHDFNLEIQDKEFVVLVGPSGCGKSTTLRMIAGLEEISSGELYIGDRLVNRVASKDRDIAMVFQNYALYPHMTVYNNVAFGLQMRRTPKREIRQKVTEAAKVLGIEELLGRKPGALSGGERQRVALGRAMVRDPAAFLLDEPLSNLDAKLRTQMRAEIIGLHKRLGTTFVYVTHDQTEAMTMADRIVVMKDGFIQQVDTPQKLYDAPCNLFVAGFIGTPQMNTAPAIVERFESGFAACVEGASIPLSQDRISAEKLTPYMGKEIILGIRPEGLSVVQDGDQPVTLHAQIDLVEPLGAEVLLYFSVGESTLVAKAPPKPGAYREGERLLLAVDTQKIHLFDACTQLAIC